jgi:hypothetical protein
MTWHDAARRLSLRLAPGARMLAPLARALDVRVAGSSRVTRVTFNGQPIDVAL